MSDAVRVLHVVTHMDCGGLETMIMNYYRKMDRSKIQFDFLSHRPETEEKDYDNEIRKLRGRIYHIPRLNPFSHRYRKVLESFFDKHKEYRIIHVHQDCMSGFILKIAKKKGIPIRIAHCHSSNQDRNIKYLIKYVYKQIIPKYATGLFACGEIAGEWMFGKKAFYRKEIREKWNIPENAFVYGFVGSLTGDKGLNELLMASREILKEHEDVRVLLIGNFEKEYSINKELLSWSKNENKVIYCGSTSYVQKYMAAMECYVMPSYREGFGLTVVVAGAMGLPVICTDIPGPTDAIHNEETGLVIEKKNEKELRDAILRIYDDSQFAKKLGQAGYENVKENYEQKNLFKYILHDREGLLRKARRRTGKR